MDLNEALTVWIVRLSDGNAEATERIWRTYFEKLAQYARRKLDGRIPAAARGFDEEDVALEALNSLYRGLQSGQIPVLDSREDLWKMLLTIAARKVSGQIRAATRQKRGGGRVRGESVFAGSDSSEAPKWSLVDVLGREPSPELASEFAETLQSFLGTIEDDRTRVIVQLKMEGYSTTEIADRLGCVKRTVERKLKQVQDNWKVGAELELVPLENCST